MTTEFVHRFAPGTLPVTVLLLHGSGGDENDLLGVARALAPGAAFLSPRGKVLERGLTRFFLQDASDIHDRTGELKEWIADACGQYGIDTAALFALGYSNGANMAAATLLLHPGAIGGACLLRARAVIAPDPLPDLGGVPVLISAGQNDDLIPPEGAERLGKVLSAAGAHVDLAIQNAGHELTPADFSLAKQWFSKVFGARNLPL